MVVEQRNKGTISPACPLFGAAMTLDAVWLHMAPLLLLGCECTRECVRTVCVKRV